MSNTLIIDSKLDEVEIALLENKRLIELQKESNDSSFSVGDIYLGKVKKLAPSLNAAFVDVGYDKDAFLHYFDLGPQLASLAKYSKGVQNKKLNSPWLKDFKMEKDINKNGNISEVLTSGQFLPVQIAKEPISTKGPRITSEITLAGRYIVLVPFSDRVSVSQKIRSKDERDRLRRLMMSIKPAGFGVIIRTVAQKKKVAELDGDLRNLMEKWERLYKNLKTAKPPKKILGELDRTSAILRDALNESFESINVNDPKLKEEIQNYLTRIAPDKANIVKQYGGKQSIFDFYGVTKQIKALFGKHVTMKSGAYLVIEHTEALHVVDVNSGSTKNSKDDQETNALQVNLESAEEVARQLKLRDIGGIIVVDFIDMRSAENRKKLHEHLKKAMAQDRAKHNVLPPSRFGLIQITRQRVRPEMFIKTTEKCPTCDGSGEIQPSILLTDEIEFKLKKIIEEYKGKSFTLCVHPFVEAFLKKGYPSLHSKWMWSHKKRFKLKTEDSFQFMDYCFLGGEGEVIEL